MVQITYSVFPVEGGWLVQAQPGDQSYTFVAGSMAEAKARELAQATWAEDRIPAEVSIKGRDGSLLGKWRYGAELAAAT
jgi:hypothetical protein